MAPATGTNTAVKKLKYQKPVITSEKIKISFFLSNLSWIDQFNMLGNVYAQSGIGGDSGYGDSGYGDSGYEDGDDDSVDGDSFGDGGNTKS